MAGQENPESQKRRLTEARPGKGHFHWNGGGWFGSQIGSSLWLLLLGVLLLFKDVGVGLGVMACFVMIQVLCTMLWRRRSRLDPYPAVQLLILINGLCALAAMILTDLFGGLEDLEPVYQGVPWWGYAVLLMYPAMMLFFLALEKAALRRQNIISDNK